MTRLIRATALALLCLPAAAVPAPPVPLVIVSIDGMGSDFIVNADKYGLRIPNLRRMQREGAWASGVKGVLPSVTYASHTTLITGASPARHGILYNETFDPLDQNKDGWYWYTEDIRVPTLWDAATDAGLGVASVDWPVTAGARIRWNIVQYWRADVANAADDHKLSRLLSTPGLLDEAERALGRYPAGYAYEVEDDRRRAGFSEWMLATHHPRLHLAYFSGLDEEEHTSWPGSPKSLAVLEALDELIGRVRTAAEKAGGGRALVAVVSDHGHSTTTRELRFNELLREAGLILLNERGRPTAWKAYGWGSGGSTAVMLKDPGDEPTRRAVAEILDRLKALPESPIQGVLDGAEARAQGGFPEAAYVVGVKPDVRIDTRMEEPVMGPAVPLGEHGHFPENREMDASFLVVGPGVPAGRELGRIDMRDVAPTLAALIGVRMPQAEGRNVLAAGQ